MEIRKSLTFNDVSLVPKFSKLASRDDVNLSHWLGYTNLDIPLVSAPMDTVTGDNMALFMSNIGGIGVIHRFQSIESQLDQVSWVKSQGGKVGAAVGINGDSWERAQKLIDTGADLICLDVAHGHTVAAIERLEKIKAEGHNITLVSANIVTASAAMDCVNAGADVLRVGVGGGSACTTRIVAGVGVPQFTAIRNVIEGLGVYRKEVGILSDGGCKNSGHIVKALAAGADAVMLGGLLAGFPVAAGDIVLVDSGKRSEIGSVIRGLQDMSGKEAEQVFSGQVDEIDFGNTLVKKKKFRGMASDSALSEYKSNESYVVEGEEFLIDIDNDFEKTMQNLISGIRVGLSYLGCNNIYNLHDEAEFVEVSAAGQLEALPHYERG